MKKKAVVFAMMILICLPTLASAQLKGLFGKKDSPKVDVDGLSARAGDLMGLVQKASLRFAEAVAAIHEAGGKKEVAEKIKQNMANLQSKPSKENSKVLITDINNGVADIEKSNSLAQIDGEEAQKFMGTSILNIGVGILLDGIAAKNGAALLNEAQGALKQVPLSSAGKIKEVIDVGQFVGQDVPPQINSMKSFSEKLIDYAKTKGIPIPSEEKIAEEAKALEKG